MKREQISKPRHSGKSILDGSKGGRGRSKHPNKRKGLTWRGGRVAPSRAVRRLQKLFDRYAYAGEDVLAFYVRVQQDRLDGYSVPLDLRMIAADRLLKMPGLIPKPAREVELEQPPKVTHVVLTREALDILLDEDQR